MCWVEETACGAAVCTETDRHSHGKGRGVHRSRQAGWPRPRSRCPQRPCRAPAQRGDSADDARARASARAWTQGGSGGRVRRPPLTAGLNDSVSRRFFCSVSIRPTDPARPSSAEMCVHDSVACLYVPAYVCAHGGLTQRMHLRLVWGGRLKLRWQRPRRTGGVVVSVRAGSQVYCTGWQCGTDSNKDSVGDHGGGLKKRAMEALAGTGRALAGLAVRLPAADGDDGPAAVGGRTAIAATATARSPAAAAPPSPSPPSAPRTGAVIAVATAAAAGGAWSHAWRERCGPPTAAFQSSTRSPAARASAAMLRSGWSSWSVPHRT
jgi:hypothetical protein